MHIYAYICSHFHLSQGVGWGSGHSTLHVEYAGGRIKYGVLFTFSLFYGYSNLACVHIHVIYRVNRAEYIIRMWLRVRNTSIHIQYVGTQPVTNV